MNKNWVVTAVNVLTGVREVTSPPTDYEKALKICKKEIHRGPGRAYHDPRPESLQLTFDFKPW